MKCGHRFCGLTERICCSIIKALLSRIILEGSSLKVVGSFWEGAFALPLPSHDHGTIHQEQNAGVRGLHHPGWMHPCMCLCAELAHALGAAPHTAAIPSSVCSPLQARCIARDILVTTRRSRLEVNCLSDSLPCGRGSKPACMQSELAD